MAPGRIDGGVKQVGSELAADEARHEAHVGQIDVGFAAPVQLGDVTVAPGCYCCGLHCDKDGEFSLAMIDATRAMKKGLLPFGPQTWKPELMVPMKFGKGVVKGVVEKMQIKLMGDAEDTMKGSLVIYWGTHALSAPMRIAPADK